MGSDWSDVFLASTGRMPRAPFVLACVVLLAITALYQAIVGPLMHWVTGWVVYPVLVFCAASVLAKRLHDRGRSGWWSAIVLLAVWVVWPRPHGFVDFLFCVVLIWAVVDLGLLPGEAGSNRYGLNPLDPSSN
jgi:uncharacterized membrane protein YhaH (DUF805 family)